MPTRKWWAANVTSTAALLVMWVTTDGWDAEETVALIGLCSAAALSYLIPNDQSNPAS